MLSVEPLEMLLPGTWKLSFVDEKDDITGEGEYTFKMAGVFDASVRDAYSGHAKWHGYWQVEDARLVMNAQEMTAWCSSCLDGGRAHKWSVELEQVHEEAFTGVATMIDNGTVRNVLFERVD